MKYFKLHSPNLKDVLYVNIKVRAIKQWGVHLIHHKIRAKLQITNYCVQYLKFKKLDNLVGLCKGEKIR